MALVGGWYQSSLNQSQAVENVRQYVAEVASLADSDLISVCLIMMDLTIFQILETMMGMLMVLQLFILVVYLDLIIYGPIKVHLAGMHM